MVEFFILNGRKIKVKLPYLNTMIKTTLNLGNS